MLNFKKISKIFSEFLNNTSTISKFEDKLSCFIRLNMKINKKLWDLEDLVRGVKLSTRRIAATKREIDKNNQIRNDLIEKIDIEIKNQMQVESFDSQNFFYSESPGMIIDRIAILSIKLFFIHKLLLVIKEEDLKRDYKKRGDIVLKQLNRIGNFLDIYLDKLRNKEIFFEAQQSIKIYNDLRIKKYIKLLQKPKNNS
jgi:hypothetical protein